MSDETKKELQRKIIDALQEAKDQRDELCESLFVAFIKNDTDFSYEAHLVNPTDTSLERVCALTGALSGDSDGLLETSKAVCELGVLEPNSAILIEDGPRTELDYVIWYHLDLYENGEKFPLQVKFNLPKGHWNYVPVRLKVLDRDGAKIPLVQRDGNEIIQEEVKHMNMDSSYRTNGEISN